MSGDVKGTADHSRQPETVSRVELFQMCEMCSHSRNLKVTFAPIQFSIKNGESGHTSRNPVSVN